MIGLSKDKRVFEKFKIAGKHGLGFLYVFNKGISFEVSGKGVVLELENAEIENVVVIKREKFEISWLEGNAKHESRFKSEKAKEIVEKIAANLKISN